MERLGAPRDDVVEQVVDPLGFSRQKPPRQIQPGRHLTREVGQVGKRTSRAVIQLLHRAGVDAAYQIGIIQIAEQAVALRDKIRGMVQVAQEKTVQALQLGRNAWRLHPAPDLGDELRHDEDETAQRLRIVDGLIRPD